MPPLLFIGLYIAFERLPYSALFGLATFVSIAWLLAQDFVPDRKAEESASSTVRELAVSLGAAVGLWILLCVALNTSKPINVVTSCSMLPVLHRGDLVFLQGGHFAAPAAGISSPLRTADLVYGNCTRTFASGVSEAIPCTLGVNLSGRTVPASNMQNDIIVFEPSPAYYGLIIHRAVAVLDYQNESMVLTKGDNNAVLDQQAGMRAVSPKSVDGRVVFVVPGLGYLKIFIFSGLDFLWRLPGGDLGYALSVFDAPAGCDYEISRPAGWQ